MDNAGEITTIIEDHVQRLSSREGSESLFDTPIVLFLGFTFPGENRHAGGRDADGVSGPTYSMMRRFNLRSSSMVLSREDVLQRVHFNDAVVSKKKDHNERRTTR